LRKAQYLELDKPNKLFVMKTTLAKFYFFLFLLILSLPAVAQQRMGGLSLYTVRNEMGADPKGTLKKVADTGYKYIESADYKDGKFYGMTPAEFKSELDKLGLIPLSAHMGMFNMVNAQQLIADVKTAGFRYFVAPVPPMGHFKFDPETRTLSMSEDLDEIVDILAAMGQKCKDAGIEFLYHNHGFEFEPNSKGIVPIIYMLEKLDPAIVNFQMDLYWVAKAGADPIDYFNLYPGRFKIWHVKDMDAEGRFAPVGTGSLAFDQMLKHKKKSGMEYYIVEQDQTFDDMKPLEAIQISHSNLKRLGFK
jgi:sugar phosphate isomerase/epimerase